MKDRGGFRDFYARCFHERLFCIFNASVLVEIALALACLDAAHNQLFESSALIGQFRIPCA